LFHVSFKIKTRALAAGRGAGAIFFLVPWFLAFLFAFLTASLRDEFKVQKRHANVFLKRLFKKGPRLGSGDLKNLKAVGR
jgi:hypothetical protein